MLRTRTFASVAAVLLAAAACGPAAKPDTGPKDDGVKPGPQPEDIELAYEAIELPGTYFAPDGLDRPSLLLVRPKKKMTLAKQRVAYQKATLEFKVVEAEMLATFLWEASGSEADDAKRLALRQEARKVLEEARAASPAAVDAVLLHNLACIAYVLGDEAAAAEALAAAVAQFPDDAGTTERRGYLAYYLVRAGKDADALAAVSGVTPSKDAPEVAYAVAWAQWRAGNDAATRAAILAAAQGWRSKSTFPALFRDTAIFAARAGASVDETVALAGELARFLKDDPAIGGQANATRKVLVDMYPAFKFSGRFAESIELIERTFAAEPPVHAIDVPGLRLNQAENAKKLGRAADLAAFTKQAVDGLAACGAACSAEDRELLAKNVFNFARYAGNLYSTSRDEQWYQAASALYAAYLALPDRADAAQVKAEADGIEATHRTPAEGAGRHDKTTMSYVVEPYAAQVLFCYDRFLQRDKALSGALSLTLEIGVDGKVAGATSSPAGGEAGLAGVAACAVELARGWTFPARTRAGTTRLTAAYALAPAAAAR